MSETQDIVVAAGVESLTRVPMFSNITLHQKEGLGDGPFSASILARYGVKGFSQFIGAQKMADKYGFSREDLDRFALLSHQRAAAATEAGAFTTEIVPVPVGDGDHVHDEGIRSDASLKAIGSVKPLQEGGVITARSAMALLPCLSSTTVR